VIDVTTGKNEPKYPFPEGCTAILASPGATKERAAMTTHNNDCIDCDFRLARVEGKLHKAGARRLIEPSRFAYPRWVGYGRSAVFHPEEVQTEVYKWPETTPVTSIPQASETYSYIDGDYGIINEHQLAMGESTCAAVFNAVPKFAGGKAQVDISVLGRIALERTKTAKDACLLMGKLGEELGYYGAEWVGPMAYMEAGEAFTVADKNEAWVFHMLPDDTGASAIWAAQRVPDGHITVVANDFIIQELDASRSDQLFSTNVYEIAERNGLWNRTSNGAKLNFAATFGKRHPFEQYCSRRVWRVFDMVAPSLKLDGEAQLSSYPFSVKPDALLTHYDIMRMNRDHYEGTKYDLTKGMAAGPFGSPLRFDRGGGLPTNITMAGQFERSISIHRTSYSFVTESRNALPDKIGAMVWFGQAAPHSTVYVPLYASASALPESYTQGSLYEHSHNAWWASTAVGNYASLEWMHMMPEVQAKQHDYETAQDEQRYKIEAEALKAYAQEPARAVAVLTDYHLANAAKHTNKWWDLFFHLLTKFHDGISLDDPHAETIKPTPLFYPLWWLKAVGFFAVEKVGADATAAPAVQQQAAVQAQLMQATPMVTSAAATQAQTQAQVAPAVAQAVSTGVSYTSLVLCMLVASVVFAGVGFTLGKQRNGGGASAHGYEALSR
jgi:dipeptidase